MDFRKIGVFLIAMMVMGVVSASPPREQKQLDLLARTGIGDGGWFVGQAQDENWDKWQYAVTDLDNDGYLEILKAKSGFYEDVPQLACEELVDTSGQRQQAALSLAGSSHVPDVLSSEAAGRPQRIREKGSQRIYYIFEEVLMHGEFESDTSKYAVCLDGDLRIAELATKNWRLSGKDGTVRTKYFISDPEKKKISEERYNNIIAERFPGAMEKEGLIHWLSAKELQSCLEQGTARDLLKESYYDFKKVNW